LAFFAFRIPSGNHPLAKVFGKILDNGARLCDDHGLLDSRNLHVDNGRLPQGMDLLQLGRCEHVTAALIDLEIIIQLELFEEPEDAVRARLREPRIL